MFENCNFNMNLDTKDLDVKNITNFKETFKNIDKLPNIKSLKQIIEELWDKEPVKHKPISVEEVIQKCEEKGWTWDPANLFCKRCYKALTPFNRSKHIGICKDCLTPPETVYVSIPKETNDKGDTKMKVKCRVCKNEVDQNKAFYNCVQGNFICHKCHKEKELKNEINRFL